MPDPEEDVPPEEQAPPPNVIKDARAAFKTPRPGELAALVFDSLVDEGAAPDNHRLRFEHPRGNLELSVSYRAQNSVLSGHIHGLEAIRAAMHIHGTDLSLVTDVERGRFELTPVGHGLVRIVMEEDDGSLIRTDWFTI